MSCVATAPGNVTYPTRNFATLGPFIYVAPRREPLRGLATLHVAMQIGLYHHRLRDARRVVSEGILIGSSLLIVRTERILTRR